MRMSPQEPAFRETGLSMHALRCVEPKQGRNPAAHATQEQKESCLLVVIAGRRQGRERFSKSPVAWPRADEEETEAAENFGSAREATMRPSGHVERSYAQLCPAFLPFS